MDYDSENWEDLKRVEESLCGLENEIRTLVTQMLGPLSSKAQDEEREKRNKAERKRMRDLWEAEKPKRDKEYKEMQERELKEKQDLLAKLKKELGE